LVSGFWHGANWTFIAWGGLHAALFMPLLLLQQNRKNTNQVAEGRILPNLKEVYQMVTTFLVVDLAWILFRANSISQAMDYIRRIFSHSLITLPEHTGLNGLFLMLLVMILVEWFQRTQKHGLQIDFVKSVPIRWFFYSIVILLIFSLGGKSETFIYFQF
jgi:D-alanyl-lipoteichoic acid acyltransferase DltB (MBOAT superfamily)